MSAKRSITLSETRAAIPLQHGLCLPTFFGGVEMKVYEGFWLQRHTIAPLN